MEDPMCWEMDYHWFAEQQKAQEKEREREKQKQKQAQRADTIDKLLSEASQQADKVDENAPGQRDYASEVADHLRSVSRDQLHR
jgi:hypothetical protein